MIGLALIYAGMGLLATLILYGIVGLVIWILSKL